MADQDPDTIGGAPTPLRPKRSEDVLTDSEIALTPEAGSSDSGGGDPGIGADDVLLRKVSASSENAIADTPTLGPTTTVPMEAVPTPTSPSSRAASFSGSSSYQEDWDIPPLDRLSMLDLLDNFALPQQLEKLSKGISAQTRRQLAKSREALKSRGQEARERMVEEWRRHRVTVVPLATATAEEQLERYRKRMGASVEKLGRQWNNTKAITMREKAAFIFGVLNIFISGYLMGGWPQYMHLWYTVQICYFMPIRFYTYHRRGYHYFLADLCYFVNLLLMLSLWVFPGSRRLLVSTYGLAYGNNAVAIVLWRNSLVFHSFDKVTSLFIHVMPCATLHCIVHLVDPALQRTRFPAIYAIQHAAPGSPVAAYAHVGSMLAWSSLPYAVWQLAYYVFITVRRREKIAAGRPTSFTWLRRSYSKTWIGRIVLALPVVLQESAFMLIQYLYAVLTMLPCPVWFRYRWASAAFLMGVFTWSIYNGATYYIDVFGTRFQKEVEALKAEVAKWHSTESLAGGGGDGGEGSAVDGGDSKKETGGGATTDSVPADDASAPVAATEAATAAASSVAPSGAADDDSEDDDNLNESTALTGHSVSGRGRADIEDIPLLDDAVTATDRNTFS